jgi:hypothetical protein
LVFANVRKDSGSGEEVPTNEDGWDLLKYGFQLTTAELTELQAMADFSFNLNGGESFVYFNGIRSTTGPNRVFNKYFKTSDLSSDYVQVTLTQSGTSFTPLDYNSASNLWKPVDDAAAAGFGYYYAGHYGAGKGSSYEIVSYAGGAYTVDAKYGTGGTWDNQLFIFPGAGHEVSLSPTSVYELQLTIESDKDITSNTLFFKISSYSEANDKGEGAGLKDYGIYNVSHFAYFMKKLETQALTIQHWQSMVWNLSRIVYRGKYLNQHLISSTVHNISALKRRPWQYDSIDSYLSEIRRL